MNLKRFITYLAISMAIFFGVPLIHWANGGTMGKGDPLPMPENIMAAVFCTAIFVGIPALLARKKS